MECKNYKQLYDESNHVKFWKLFFVWACVIETRFFVCKKHLNSFLQWIDACPVMKTDGGRNQRNLLARLEFVYSGAIAASDNHNLSGLQLTHSVPYGMRILGAPLRTSNDLHHKIIDHRAKRVA